MYNEQYIIILFTRLSHYYTEYDIQYYADMYM